MNDNKEMQELKERSRTKNKRFEKNPCTSLHEVKIKGAAVFHFMSNDDVFCCHNIKETSYIILKARSIEAFQYV